MFICCQYTTLRGTYIGSKLNCFQILLLLSFFKIFSLQVLQQDLKHFKHILLTIGCYPYHRTGAFYISGYIVNLDWNFLGLAWNILCRTLQAQSRFGLHFILITYIFLSSTHIWRYLYAFTRYMNQFNNILQRLIKKM